MSRKKVEEVQVEETKAVVLPEGFDVAVTLQDGDLIQVRGIDGYYQDGAVVCRAKDVSLVAGELDRQRNGR